MNGILCNIFTLFLNDCLDHRQVSSINDMIMIR